MNHIAVLAMFALGIRAVIEDARRSRIDNKWIAAGLLLSLCSYLYLAVNTALGSQKITFFFLGVYYLPASFFWGLLLHLALGLLSGLALWYLKLWPAGDAKLYMALSSLLVLADFNLRGFPRFLWLAVLVNIFAAAGLYVVGIMFCEGAVFLLRLRHGRSRSDLHAAADKLFRRIGDEWPWRYRYLTLAWNIFVLFLFFRFIRIPLRLPLLGIMEPLALYFVFYLLWDSLCGLFLRKDLARVSFFFLTLALVPAGVYLKWDVVSHLIKSGQLALGFGLFFMMARLFVDYYLLQSRMIPVPVAELQEGMILSGEAWTSLRDAREPSEAPVAYADGLSVEDLETVKNKFALRSISEVKICRHRPFAFWIFFGFLWSLYCRQNLVEWLTARWH